LNNPAEAENFSKTSSSHRVQTKINRRFVPFKISKLQTPEPVGDTPNCSFSEYWKLRVASVLRTWVS